MTDLDNTQIINADESLVDNSTTIDTKASLKVVNDADSTIYPLEKETIIGRANPSTLVITEPSLSKQHAKINLTNGQYFITDLGSSNKTFQNKIQLQPNVCYALHDGDEIKLGDLLCTFQEQKLSTKPDNDRHSEPSHQTYVPVVNTLVEEDSPWNLDNEEEEEDIRPPNVEETNIEVVPTTQPISDSYDDDETPTQPMKIWNENANNNNNNRLSRLSNKSLNSEDITTKSNGNHDTPSNGSSTFIPPATTTIPNDDHDDGSLVIGSSTLPATVPLDIESTQINDDDNQIEIVSTCQTKQIIEEIDENTVRIETTTTTTEVEFENTQCYTLEPTGEAHQPSTNDQLVETQSYEMENETVVTDVVETKEEEKIHKVVIGDEEMIEKVTTTTTTTTTTVVMEQEKENPIMQTLAYDLQAIPPVMETTNINNDTQAYDLDEEINQTKAKSPVKNEENIIEIPIVKTTTNASNEFPETQLNEDMSEPTETLANVDMAMTETQVNDQMEQIETIANDEKEMAETQVNDQMEQIATIANDDIPMENDTQINDQMEVEPKEVDSNEKKENVIEEDSSTKPETMPMDSTLESEEGEETTTTGQTQRGTSRRNSRRGRGRRGAGATGISRVVSPRISSGRRNPINVHSTSTTSDNENQNSTLEETSQTETEKESPTKPSTENSTTSETEPKTNDTQPMEEPVTETETPNIRVSARIKARASSGRNRQFPFTDDYVDLDDLEKQSKAASVSSVTRKSSRGATSTGGRQSSTLQKRISVRQQATENNESSDEKLTKSKDQSETREEMDTGGENEEPMTDETNATTSNTSRNRKSATSTTSKRGRSSSTTRAKQTSDVEISTTAKRTRKSAKDETNVDVEDRPVRIALSSHLNFDQNHLDILRQLGFEIMDESCQVDALVVDRIRRTKKFFMCLARGAHILSPTWIETMIKENRYLPYDKFYLNDTTAETRYGFQLRESVRLAKQRAIFANYKIFCTKETSPPYEDLKDIVEAAGGKFIDKINTSRPGKNLICIVAQNHKNEYEDLHKKGVPIVSEEFALSGISKQKLDFESFSLFQPSSTTGTK